MPRLPLTLLACLALAAGGVLAGCGDDGDDSSGSASPPPAAAPPPPPPASAASGDPVKVTMKSLKYVPEEITAKVGQKISWENTDGDIPHTVTASDGADFDSGNMDGGDTFEFTPTEAGEIAYFCKIHSNQKGSITVEE